MTIFSYKCLIVLSSCHHLSPPKQPFRLVVRVAGVTNSNLIGDVSVHVPISFVRRLAMYIQLEQDVVTPQFLQAIKAAIEIASELPRDQQNELAQLLLDEITDWKWEGTPEFR